MNRFSRKLHEHGICKPLSHSNLFLLTSSHLLVTCFSLSLCFSAVNCEGMKCILCSPYCVGYIPISNSFWLTDKTLLDFVFFVFVQVIKYGVRSETFTVANVDKIFSGYQSCQLVKY